VKVREPYIPRFGKDCAQTIVQGAVTPERCPASISARQIRLRSVTPRGHAAFCALRVNASGSRDWLKITFS
jgi:hypothetical protein